MVCASEGGHPKETNHTPLKTMTKNTFQSSAKKASKKETHFLRDTAANIVGGSTAATVTNILGEIVEDAGEAIANKILPGSGKAVGAAIDFAIDSGTAIVLNEGLEVSRDGESFFNDDFVEDALVAVASNATAAVVVGILGATGAPALALGLLTSAVMGAAYSVATSLDDRFALPTTSNQDEVTPNTQNTPARQQENSNTLSGSQEQSNQEAGQPNASPNGSIQNDPLNQETIPNTPSQEGSGQSDPSQAEPSKEGGTRWVNTGAKEEVVDEDGRHSGYIEYQKEVDSEGNPTGNWRVTEDGDQDNQEGAVVWSDNDSDGDGYPDREDDSPQDSSAHMENPMNDNSDTSDYDGKHNGLRDFRGEIDYGPDGKQGEGYNGEHDELIGFNPRIDYGPDHVNNGAFEGNELTKRLGKINPRALQEAIMESTAFADNKRQTRKMARTDSMYIINTKSDVIYHNANGSKKGFGSGGAIAELEIDQDLSLVSVDFL